MTTAVDIHLEKEPSRHPSIQPISVDYSAEPAATITMSTVALDSQSLTFEEIQVISPGLVALNVTGVRKLQEGDSSARQDPRTSGYLSIRDAHAVSSTYKDRFFFFSDVPIPLKRLQAYHKKHKKKDDIEHLDRLVAQAACSGRALLFYSEKEDSAIKGIIDLTRVVRCSESRSIVNHFEMLLREPTELLYFDTFAVKPINWITLIIDRKHTSRNLVQAIWSTKIYKTTLQSLEAGEAFDSVDVPDGASEAFSGDQTAGAIASPNKLKKFFKLLADTTRALSPRALSYKLIYTERA